MVEQTHVIDDLGERKKCYTCYRPCNDSHADGHRTQWAKNKGYCEIYHYTRGKG